MAKKKKKTDYSEQSLAMPIGKLLDPGFKAETKTKKKSKAPERSSVSSEVMTVELQLEKKGRGGHPVVLMKKRQGSMKLLESSGKEIKKALSCGASFKEGQWILQTQNREVVKSWLEKRGHKVVLSGG